MSNYAYAVQYAMGVFNRSEALTDTDLSELDLRNLMLAGINPRGAADLRAADLTGTEFRKCDLRGVDLRAADLTGTEFRKCDLRTADFRDTTTDTDGLRKLPHRRCLRAVTWSVRGNYRGKALRLVETLTEPLRGKIVEYRFGNAEHSILKEVVVSVTIPAGARVVRIKDGAVLCSTYTTDFGEHWVMTPKNAPVWQGGTPVFSIEEVGGSDV